MPVEPILTKHATTNLDPTRQRVIVITTDEENQLPILRGTFRLPEGLLEAGE